MPKSFSDMTPLAPRSFFAQDNTLKWLLMEEDIDSDLGRTMIPCPVAAYPHPLLEGLTTRALGMLNYVSVNVLHYPEQRIQLMNLYDGTSDSGPARERAEKHRFQVQSFERY